MLEAARWPDFGGDNTQTNVDVFVLLAYARAFRLKTGPTP